MKLFRYREEGKERPGVAAGEKHYRLEDLAPGVGDYDPDFFASDGTEKIRAALAAGPRAEPLDPAALAFACPLVKPSKILGLGLNYADHAAESRSKVPDRPIVFAKAPSALNGPFDEIVLPAMSNQVDWEVELAFVVGKRAKKAPAASWREFVWGFTVVNDVSARDCQFGDQQWFRGKSFDTFAPTGPYLVSLDESGDADNLRLWSRVNGEPQQDDNTAHLVFPVPFLVEFISQAMTLMPGDLVATGTPPGVGRFQDPPRFLRAGDVVEIGVDGLGAQRTPVV